MISRNGYRVELRHVLRSKLKNIGDDTHREFRRINIGITHHKFFQNIVLNRSGHLLEFRALFQPGIDIKSKDRQHGSVHRHGYRHFVQRDTVEQNLHIFERTNRYTGLTYIAYHTFVIGIISSVCREVECHSQSLLSRSQVSTIESIGLLCGRETCILTDCPRTNGIHTAVRATKKRRKSGYIIQVFKTFEVFFGVNRFDGYQLRGYPVFTLMGYFPCRMGESILRNIYILKIRSHCLFVFSCVIQIVRL